ncbi:unnamed protein product [Musa hybrid cultivar]
MLPPNFLVNFASCASNSCLSCDNDPQALEYKKFSSESDEDLELCWLSYHEDIRYDFTCAGVQGEVAMNSFGERPQTWSGDSVSTPSELAYGRDGSWKDLGTSMSAISFGLAATAILISMFLVMAIFEHLIKPRASLLSSRDSATESSEMRQPHAQVHLQKFQHPVAVGTQYTADFSVLMPGQQYPTFIAQPAPLPCPREGIQWPPHDPHISFM